MIQQIKLELYKMLKSKTTYLLAVTLLVPVIFGVGMFFQVSFLVNDGGEGIDVIGGHGISGLDFTMNMMMQIHYITVFLFLVISAITLSREIERGQVRLYAVRVCDRGKIVLSKFFALTIVQLAYYAVFILFSLCIYFLFVIHSKYGSGRLLSSAYVAQLCAFGVRFLGVMAITSINLCLGVKLKSFACFAATYIFWIMSKYLSFFENIKLFVPDNFADHLLMNSLSFAENLPNLIAFSIYIVVPLALCVVLFKRKDFS